MGPRLSDQRWSGSTERRTQQSRRCQCFGRHQNFRRKHSSERYELNALADYHAQSNAEP